MSSISCTMVFWAIVIRSVQGADKATLPRRGNKPHCPTSNSAPIPGRLTEILFGKLKPGLSEWLEQREEDGLPNASAGQDHHQPVDAHAHSARRGHTVFE